MGTKRDSGRLTGGLTACNKDQGTKSSSEGFSQEMQGRRVDEALFRDLGEFRLDERSARGGKEGEDGTECLINTYKRQLQL